MLLVVRMAEVLGPLDELLKIAPGGARVLFRLAKIDTRFEPPQVSFREPLQTMSSVCISRSIFVG